MVEKISTLTDFEQISSPFEMELCEFPEYTGEQDSSLMIHIPANSRNQRIHVAVSHDGSFNDIAFDACSLRLPITNLKSAGQAFYAVDTGVMAQEEVVDGEKIEVAIGNFDTITVPYKPLFKFDIVVLSDNADVLIISNLRAVTDELPQDILQGFTHIDLPKFSIGTITASKGSHKIQVEDITNLVEGAVLLIGQERHQVKGLIGDIVTFEDTEDGMSLLQDYEDEEIFIECPIRIGYYDQDLKLPSLVLWFSSPTPDLRAIRREEYKVFGNDAYVKERTQFEDWTVRLDIVGGSPEMVQLVASFVRKFLEKNKIFINGKRFTFEWTDGAVDTEPSSYLDIQPSVAYNITISLQEEFLWQTIQKGSGRLRNVTPTQEIL